MPTTPETPDDLADANILESIRALGRWQDPCEISEEGGILLVAGANESARGYRNCVARVDPDVPAADVLGAARDFFGRRGRGFALCIRAVRDADLQSLALSQGMTQRSDAPSMWIDRPVALGQLPEGVVMEAFSTLRHVQDSVEISAEAYQALQVPADEMRLYFSHPERLLEERVPGFVAYSDGRALSTAITIMSGRSAGLYFVGTRKHAERRGLAELCTRFATNAGFERGARIVTLQASPGGEPIYRRLGYREYDRLCWFR